jgi:hypothetical protein
MNTMVMSFTPNFSWVTGNDRLINNRFNGFLVLIETAKAVSKRILTFSAPS